MRLHRATVLVVATLALASAGAATRLAGSGAGIPTSLTDQQFWSLSEALSEPDGAFGSDNLLSNERVFARLVPDLIQQTTPGGVYLGVGPEQNFTYIAAMKPAIAFITDIRRGNLHLQLMYKALFELSRDRADFVSRLFTKPRPSGLTASSSVTDIMNAYWDTNSDGEAAYEANLEAIRLHLTRTHSLPLSEDDFAGIARVYRAFYWYGPSITYSARTSLTAGTSFFGTNYWDLMTQTDPAGRGLSYLGSEEAFNVVKTLESRNLIVPVVGDFAGPKALRAVGAWIRDHDATVTAFYLSNVESYLRRGSQWPAFCANVATMPITDTSVFIRPSALGLLGGALSYVVVRTTDDGRGGRRIELTRPPTPTVTPTSTPPGRAENPTSLPSGLVPIGEDVKGCK